MSAQIDSVSRPPLPQTFTLTRVSAGDALVLASWVDTSRDYYDEWEAQGGQCFVGSVAGEAVFRAWQSTSPKVITRLIPWVTAPEQCAYLFDVETLPQHRGRGYAKTFLIELVSRSRTELVLARVVMTNEPAMQAFKSAGFQTDGLLTEWFAAGRRLGWRRGRG
jgi:ribosomal protein S18 acetylase RimI-like enzyme